jgi:hypothetical protein
VFQLTPSDVDLYWYAGKIMFVIGIIHMLLITVGFDPIPSSSVDMLFGICLLALVPVVEQASDSTPLYKELDLGDN